MSTPKLSGGKTRNIRVDRRRYGGDPNVVGKQIMVGCESTTAAGIMPPPFKYPERTEIQFPLTLDAAAERRSFFSRNILRGR